MSSRKLFGKQDLILIAALIALALVSLGIYSLLHRNAGKPICEISYDGKVIETVDLSENRQFTLEQNGHIHFEVKNNSIAFTGSDCPDKVCVNSGYLSHPGQMTACLPNRVSIRIIGDAGHDGADVVAG